MEFEEFAEHFRRRVAQRRQAFEKALAELEAERSGRPVQRQHAEKQLAPEPTPMPEHPAARRRRGSRAGAVAGVLRRV